MTVSNTEPLVENKTGNGTWTTINVTPGQIVQNSDGTHAIIVLKTTIADGTLTTLTETTDYTVALDGDSPSTGVITMVAGAPSTAYRFTVLSDLPLTQEVELENGTIIDVKNIEHALDTIVLQMQSMQEKIDRAVLLSPDALTRQVTLPSLEAADSEGKVLAVNADHEFDLISQTTATATSLGLGTVAFVNNTFSTVHVTGQSDISASGATGTFTITPGTGISASVSGTTVTLTSTASTSINFAGVLVNKSIFNS